MSRSPQIVGLDIGTTKICAVIGEVNDDDKLEVIALGESKSTGMRKGMIINLEQTVRSIRQAVESAEQFADREIDSVYAGIAGSHIEAKNSDGVVAIKGGVVTERDVDRVIDQAKVLSIPADKEVIHTLPQEFIIDNQRGIIDPLGMAGVRLEVKVHIVTGAVAAAQNIVRSCHMSQLEVADLALESLASAKAVLTQEEKEIGVALVDIGGGTTDIAIFANNTIQHTAVLAAGGQVVSNDIAFGLRTPLAAAEKIKVKYGCALMDMTREDDMIEVPSVGFRQPTLVSRYFLATICESRMAEILGMVDQILKRSEYKDKLGAGVVLTGGTAMMEGCQELGEQIFGLQTRIGYPRDIYGGIKDMFNNPKYATAVGLLRYGAENELSGQKKFNATTETGIFEGILKRMKNWFKEVK